MGDGGGGAGSRAAVTGAAERVVHDGSDGARATSALRAAAEAAIDFTGFPRARFVRDRIADLGFGKDVARTDDHGRFSIAQIRITLTCCSYTFFCDRPEAFRQLNSK